MLKILSILPVRNKKGQGLVEYALILVLVAIVVIVVLGTVGDGVNNVFQQIVAKLPS
jgi:pilus assembly protein Flp/PilA